MVNLIILIKIIKFVTNNFVCIAMHVFCLFLICYHCLMFIQFCLDNTYWGTTLALLFEIISYFYKMDFIFSLIFFLHRMVLVKVRLCRVKGGGMYRADYSIPCYFPHFQSFLVPVPVQSSISFLHIASLRIHSHQRVIFRISFYGLWMI